MANISTNDKMFTSPRTLLDPKKAKAKYPEARVIVLDDSFNTFQHVSDCLLKIIPGMSEKKAWDLTIKVDNSGSAEVWRGIRIPLHTSAEPELSTLIVKSHAFFSLIPGMIFRRQSETC